MAIRSFISFTSPKENDWLLHKYEETEFNTLSVLAVTTGQVAILVHNGKIERICEEGRYRLDTELLPFVKNFPKAIFGGVNTYPMEIYFINKRLKLDLYWGTAAPLTMLDQVYNIQLNIKARGQLGVKLVDYQFFLESLVGSLMQDSYIKFAIIQDYFRGVINQKVKKNIAKYLIDRKMTFYDVASHMDEIQAMFEEDLRKEFKKFGFEIVNLSIESISVPEGDLDELNKILHKKAEYNQLGDAVYRTARGYDVLEAGAKNNAAAGSIIGLGLGAGIVNQEKGVGAIIPPAANKEENKAPARTCPNCGAEVAADARFCSRCGAKLSKQCPQCGGAVESEDKFCPHCGAKL